MFKSIFSKYITVISLIVLVSFAAMGGMQVLFSTRYWAKDKEEMLGKYAENVAKLTSEIVTTEDGKNYDIPGATLSHLLRIPSLDSSDASVLITDNKGGIVMHANSDASINAIDSVPSDMITQLQGRPYFAVGTLGDTYSSRQYISGRPIVLSDATRIGYVFVALPAYRLGGYISEILQVFLLSSLGVLALTFIVVYALSYRMVRPLREMATATRRFSVGDFSTRLPVHGKDEVAELATSLNNMAVSLSSLEGMRRSFVANVSHELKTPMTTIAGFIDGILDGTIPTEKHAYYLKIVSDEVKRLSRLVKSMLDLSRIDNGEMRLTPVRFDLTEVACTALLSFERRIEGKRIQITGLEDCERVDVMADYDLIGQVVYNLLDNAVKFTNEDGYIDIRLGKEDGRVTCTIRNSGIGIPANEMPHIFERFYKSDKSRSLDKNGVGLGLYIVKTVINLHHGEIYVRSAEGEYCEFGFWLPDIKND